jgi:ribosomal protein S12 methylthiotransferase accessory factor
MLNIPIERTVDVIEARSRLESTLRTSGIHWKTEITGQFVFTAKTTLYDEFEIELDYGYGKGDIESSKTGSIFEAAEHYFAQFVNSSRENVRYEDSYVFAANYPYRDDIPISGIADSNRATIALREYILIGGADRLMHPVALSSPKYVDDLYLNRSKYAPDDFDYSKIERYCSNSGVAIGSTEEEAVVHGLLEAIERESLSRFLVRAFLYRDKDAIRTVRRQSLPVQLRQLLGDVECEVGHEVILVELKNPFGIPVFCSALKNSDFSIEIAGYGCSLSRDHAASRSLFELAQCYHATIWFHPKEFQNKMEQIMSKLANHPFHLRCAKLKLAEWGEAVGTRLIDFSDTSHVEYSTDVREYLAQIVEKIEANGRCAYSTRVSRLSGGQVFAHSFLDQQDYFFCVTEGSFVFPRLQAEV